MPDNAEVWAEKLDAIILMDIEPPSEGDITNMTIFGCAPKDGSSKECRVLTQNVKFRNIDDKNCVQLRIQWAF